jgi:hypothetical protein
LEGISRSEASGKWQMKNNVRKSKITHLNKEKEAQVIFIRVWVLGIFSCNPRNGLKNHNQSFTEDYLLLPLPERLARCSDSQKKDWINPGRIPLPLCKAMVCITPQQCSGLRF